MRTLWNLANIVLVLTACTACKKGNANSDTFDSSSSRVSSSSSGGCSVSGASNNGVFEGTIITPSGEVIKVSSQAELDRVAAEKCGGSSQTSSGTSTQRQGSTSSTQSCSVSVSSANGQWTGRLSANGTVYTAKSQEELDKLTAEKCGSSSSSTITPSNGTSISSGSNSCSVSASSANGVFSGTVIANGQVFTATSQAQLNDLITQKCK